MNMHKFIKKLLSRSGNVYGGIVTRVDDNLLGGEIIIPKPFYRITQELNSGVIFYRSAYITHEINPYAYRMKHYGRYVKVEQDYKYFDNEKDAKNWRSENEDD